MPHRVRVCGVLQRRNHWGFLCCQLGSPFVIQAPLKRELASRRLTEGFLRKSETLCKRSQQYPSTSFAGPPPFSREAIFIQAPLCYLGSLEKGAGSRRLTEGFLRKSETLCKRSQQYPSTSFAGPPPFSREAIFIQAPLCYLGSLEKGAGSRRLTEGFLRKSFTSSKRFQKQKNGTPLPECRLSLLLFYSIFEKICVLKIICAYLTMYLPIDSTSFSGSSV